MSFVGIDIGTTGSKAVAFDEAGRAIAQAYREYATQSPQAGWFELDPRVVMQACRDVLREVAVAVRAQDPVRALGVSSQGEAFTCLDEHDAYLCPAMVSFDTRSTEQVARFATGFGAERLYRITGHSPHTLFSLFKLLWLKHHAPAAYRRIRRVMCFGDLLTYQLTGVAAISPNLASRTMCFDVTQRRYSREILAALELDAVCFSQPVDAAEPIGPILPSVAQELGLPADVLVACGGHDQSCGALGVGVTGSSRAAYSLGTVECITPAFGRPVFADTMRRGNLATYPHVVEGLYTTVAFNMTGGSLLRWYRDTLASAEATQARQVRQDVYEAILADLPPEPTNLMVQPHFTSTGTPHFDPHSVGAILGLRLTTTRAELVKALLEGVTYEMKLNLELLKQAGVAVDHLHAFGGGAKNQRCLQLKADILDAPVDVLPVTEAGCLGAAMLAARATGSVRSLSELAARWTRPHQTWHPDEKRSAAYRARYDIYRDLYHQLKPLAARLHAIPASYGE